MHLSNLEWLCVALVVAGILILVFTPSAPRGIDQHPSCYGSNPGPQERAENDCETCSWQHSCLYIKPRYIAWDKQWNRIGYRDTPQYPGQQPTGERS